MSLIHFLLIHLIGFVLFMIFDTFIGIIDDEEDLNLVLVVAILWELFFPLFILEKIYNTLSSIKKKRIARQKSKEQIRISLLKEEEELMKEVSKEIEQENYKKFTF